MLINLDPQRTLHALSGMAAQPLGKFSDAELLGGGGSDLIGQYMCGNVSNDDFLHTLQRLCRPDVSLDAIRSAWNSMLLCLPQQRVDTIRILHRQGVRIALLSNINEEHLNTTLRMFAEADLEIGRDIDYAFFSNEMHHAKPAPAIYKAMLQRTGFVPQETLYIDDLPQNIEAGAAFGLQTLQAIGDEWLNPVRQALNLR